MWARCVNYLGDWLLGSNTYTNTFKRQIWAILLLAFSVLAVPSAWANPPVSKANEDQVRAAVVVGIVRYTIWNHDLGGALRFCLVGESPSFPFIRALHNQKRFLGIPLKIVNLAADDNEGLGSCEVVVVGQNAKNIASLGSVTSCLTICDRCDDGADQSAVVIRKVDNRIRFSVSLQKAKNAGIAFKSAMLELAAHVEGYSE